MSYNRKPNGRLQRINVNWNKRKRKNMLHVLSSATPKQSSRNRFKCFESNNFMPTCRDEFPIYQSKGSHIMVMDPALHWLYPFASTGTSSTSQTNLCKADNQWVHSFKNKTLHQKLHVAKSYNTIIFNSERCIWGMQIKLKWGFCICPSGITSYRLVGKYQALWIHIPWKRGKRFLQNTGMYHPRLHNV